MDKELIKFIHRANQLTKQNIFCIISSASRNNFMESDRKHIVKFFYLNKLILTNFRTQISKPSLLHQLFFELRNEQLVSLSLILKFSFHVITIAQRNGMYEAPQCELLGSLHFQFIKLPIYDYCLGISPVLILLK